MLLPDLGWLDTNRCRTMDSDQIINKVEASGLVQLELKDLLPNVDVVGLDLAPFLWQGMVLREKEFRQEMKELRAAEWSNATVALHCSADAIIPDWAWMLASCAVLDAGSTVEIGDVASVRTRLHVLHISSMDVSAYAEARVVVKGCSDWGGPEVLSALVCRLQPVVKSLMFGEACSTVPIFKRRQ